MFGYPRHNIGNLKVEIDAFLSHREGEAMVHPQHGKCELRICDWRKLQDDFYHSFSPLSPTPSVWSEILAFDKFEKESLRAAWARFSRLLVTCPYMLLSDEVSSLHNFCAGLDMTSALDLEITTRGSSAYKTPAEAKKILDHFLEARTLQES